MTYRMPVRIRGVVYPSATAAAKALGVKQCTISVALSKGTEDKIGNGRGGHNAVPVTIDGVTYPSLRAAERGTGLPLSLIQRKYRK